MRMFKLFFALIAFGSALIYSGVKEYRLVTSNPEIYSLTLDEFVTDVPDQNWVEVTGGYWDIADAFHIYEDGDDDEPTKKVFAPYRLMDDTYENPIYLFIATRDEKIVKMYNSFVETFESEDEDAVNEYIAENLDNVFLEAPANGVLMLGREAGELKGESLLSEINNAYPTLDYDFYVLDEGKEPSIKGAITHILGGLGLAVGGGAGGVTSMRKRSRDNQSADHDEFETSKF